MPLDFDGLDGVLQVGQPTELITLPTMVADEPPPPPPPNIPRFVVGPEPPLPAATREPARRRRVAFLIGAIGIVVAAMIAVAALVPSERSDGPSLAPLAAPASPPAEATTLAPPISSAKPTEAEAVLPEAVPPSPGAAPAKMAPVVASTEPPAEARPTPQEAEDLGETRLPFRFGFNGVRSLPLSPEEADQLGLIIRGLAERCGSASATVELTGHTDDLGSARANKIVGLGRATHVRALLARRPDAPPMTVATAGSSRPIASNQTRDGQSANRRVTVACAPGVSQTKESRP